MSIEFCDLIQYALLLHINFIVIVLLLNISNRFNSTLRAMFLHENKIKNKFKIFKNIIILIL